MLTHRPSDNLVLALVACGVFALPAACSSSSTSNTGNDAGGNHDSSTTVPDAKGGKPDANKGKPDAHKGTDAGNPHDAGVDSHVAPHDAGTDNSVAPIDAGVDSGNTCAAGTARCTGDGGVETCEGGTWGTATACEYVCTSGSCTGMCVPGTMQCSATFYPQTCNASGTFTGPSTCATDTDCCGGQAYCNVPTGQSTGACAAKLASEADCTADDQCISGECIQGDGGSKICE